MSVCISMCAEWILYQKYSRLEQLLYFIVAGLSVCVCVHKLHVHASIVACSGASLCRTYTYILDMSVYLCICAYVCVCV